MQGIFKEIFTTAQFPLPSLPPHPFLPSSSLPSLLLLSPFLAGVRGYHPGKIFGIRDAHR